MTKIYKFTSPTCQPCKTYSPLIEDVAKTLKLEVEHVDVSEEPHFAAASGVRSVPTLMVGDSYLVGAKSRQELTTWLKENV